MVCLMQQHRLYLTIKLYTSCSTHVTFSHAGLFYSTSMSRQSPTPSVRSSRLSPRPTTLGERSRSVSPHCPSPRPERSRTQSVRSTTGSFHLPTTSWICKTASTTATPASLLSPARSMCSATARDKTASVSPRLNSSIEESMHSARHISGGSPRGRSPVASPRSQTSIRGRSAPSSIHGQQDTPRSGGASVRSGRASSRALSLSPSSLSATPRSSHSPEALARDASPGSRVQQGRPAVLPEASRQTVASARASSSSMKPSPLRAFVAGKYHAHQQASTDRQQSTHSARTTPSTSPEDMYKYGCYGDVPEQLQNGTQDDPRTLASPILPFLSGRHTPDAASHASTPRGSKFRAQKLWILACYVSHILSCAHTKHVGHNSLYTSQTFGQQQKVCFPATTCLTRALINHMSRKLDSTTLVFAHTNLIVARPCFTGVKTNCDM
jgi:hypothetical protein